MLFGTEIFEIEILKFIQSILGCEFMDFLMPKISALGNGGFIWILCAAILVCTKKYRRCGITMLAGMLAGLLVGNLLLKNIIARPRPCWIESTYPLLIENPTDFSHPSGHTLSSFIAAFILNKTDKRFGYAAIPLACLIAFSRIYLFVHFPTDILAGVVLAYVIYRLLMFCPSSNASGHPSP